MSDPELIREFELLWSQLALSPVRDGVWWDQCKCKFKELLVFHSRRLSRLKYQQLKEYEERLRFISAMSVQNNNVYSVQVDLLKNKIKSLLDGQLQGAHIRSRVQYLDLNEAPSSHYVKREKTNACKKGISRLVDQQGVHTDKEGIINCCVDFYSDLYKGEPVDSSLLDMFLSDIPQLSEEDQLSCEGVIT